MVEEVGPHWPSSFQFPFQKNRRPSLATAFDRHESISLQLYVPVPEAANQLQDILTSVDLVVSEAPLFELSFDLLGHRIVISIQTDKVEQVADKHTIEVVICLHVLLCSGRQHGLSYFGLFQPFPLS
jgi:hypothetical protein